MLVERLAVYPDFVAATSDRWIAPGLRTRVLRMADAEGFARDRRMDAGRRRRRRRRMPAVGPRAGLLTPILDRAIAGRELSESDLVALFAARGESFHEVCAAADALARRNVRRAASATSSPATSTTPMSAPTAARSAPSPRARRTSTCAAGPTTCRCDEIVRRCREAWERGATEVCLQGGIHPRYTGETYLAICRAIKTAVPDLHIHAFSPLEISQGAATLGMSVPDFLGRSESRRARLAARHRGRNPRRRGPRRDLPRQGHDRSNGST